MNKVVKLPCLKPSNLATLTWTSSRFKDLPDSVFIQSADGSLSFLATADTLGIYRCEAEEGSYKEVVTSYDVRQIAPPRSMRPIPKGDDHHVLTNKDKINEDIVTPVPSETPPSGEPEDDTRMAKGDRFTTETDSNKDDLESINFQNLDFTVTLRQDPQFRKEEFDDDVKMTVEKTYYSELVVVSLLLASCICVLVLTGLHAWYQRRTGLKVNPLVSPEDGTKTNQSLENVPSLSSPDDPEVGVVE